MFKLLKLCRVIKYSLIFLLFQEINFLVHMKGSFLVVDQSALGAEGFNGKGKAPPALS